jgi:hypothetical protein
MILKTLDLLPACDKQIEEVEADCQPNQNAADTFLNHFTHRIFQNIKV